MTIFEDLIPDPIPAGVKVLYGTVTGSSPLRVQVDRDPGPLPVTPTTTVACAVGDRVVMLSHVRADNPDARARAVVIVGVIGQGDAGWIDCTLTSGYTGDFKVRRLGKMIHLAGTVTRTAGEFPAGAYEQIAAIPVGFRPSRLLRLVAGAYASSVYRAVLLSLPTAGEVFVGGVGDSSNVAYITGLSYLLD